MKIFLSIREQVNYFWLISVRARFFTTESTPISKVHRVTPHQNGWHVVVISVYHRQFGLSEFFCTIWSVVIFRFLMNYPSPNVNHNSQLISRLVKNRKNPVDSYWFSFLSIECVQLIEQCLAIRSSERPTLEQCLQSNWLKLPSSRDLCLSRRRSSPSNRGKRPSSTRTWRSSRLR